LRKSVSQVWYPDLWHRLVFTAASVHDLQRICIAKAGDIRYRYLHSLARHTPWVKKQGT